MQNIQASSATSPNPRFEKRPRAAGEDNLQWLAAGTPRDGASIVLVGGVDNHAFRIRVAQSHARDSFTPSHWSHAFLMFGISTTVYEISLDPPRGFGYAASTNGLQEGSLGRYASVAEFPNIAIVNIPLTEQEVMPVLVKYKQQRAVLDGVDLVIRWLAFTWGVGGTGNPLLEGYGLPSAAMLEIVCNAAGYDITPNTPSRGSSPEAIWQATKWWYEFPRGDKPAPEGSWVTDHQLGNQSEAEAHPRLSEYMKTRGVAPVPESGKPRAAKKRPRRARSRQR